MVSTLEYEAVERVGDSQQAGNTSKQVSAASTQANELHFVGLVQATLLWNASKQTVSAKLYVE